MYITIGPPLAGKTTWLRQRSIVDVALDDQPGVYLPLPSKVFSAELTDQTKRILRNKIVHGKSVYSRIQSNKELSYVMRRCNNEMSAEEFATVIRSIYGGPKESSELVALVTECYERVLVENGTNPAETTDLFIPEALFRPHPNSKISGINSALKALESISLREKVAWGNTNTKPSDYEIALLIAQKQGRYVKFIVYDAISGDSSVSETCELPFLGFDGLLQRNLRRYIKTGRYIPAQVLFDMNTRAQDIILRLDEVWQKQAPPESALENKIRDEILARMALGLNTSLRG
eukprot:scaffold34608_cov172-Amphora_coffeaeformis.AAC.11